MSKIKEFMEKEVEEPKKKVYEAMTGQEIATELGITRQGVSQTLKRALVKLHNGMKKETGEKDDFETAVNVMIGLGVEDMDTSKFFKLYPPDMRKKIEAAANKRLHK